MLGESARRDTGPVLRPALLPLNHPLCYPTLLKAQIGRNDNPLAASQLGAETASPPTQLSLEEKITQLYETQRVIDVLNSYAYTLDSCMVDSAYSHAWAALFTPNCVISYPFGTHVGREGLAQFAMGAELRFYRMVHLSSNFTVKIASPTLAYARSTLNAVHATHAQDLGQNFFEGGYYYWTLEKQGDSWKIAKLTLDAVWWMGDSLGLNEPHEKINLGDNKM